MQIEEDVINRDLHSYLHHKKADIIVSLFIQNISKFLTHLTPRRLSIKLWPISRHGFRV